MEGVEIALAFIITLFPSLGEAAAVTTAPSNYTSMADNTTMIGATAFNVTDSTAAGNSTTPSVHRSNRGKGMNLKGYKNVTTIEFEFMFRQ